MEKSENNMCEDCIERMNIIEYLNEHNITWGYLNNDFFSGEKKYSNGVNYTGTFLLSSFKSKKIQEVFKTQERYIKYIKKSQKTPTNLIAYDTTIVNCLDIDCKKYNYNIEKSKYPYVLSNNKKLPHFFLKFTDLPPNKEDNFRIDGGNIDILKGQGAFSKPDAEVINSDIGIEELNVKKFLRKYRKEKHDNLYRQKKIIKKKADSSVQVKSESELSFTSEALLYVLRALPAKALNDFSDWFSISSFIKKYFNDYDLWCEISSKSGKSANNTETMWNQLPTAIEFNDGFIVNLMNKYNIKIEYNFLADEDSEKEIDLAFNKAFFKKMCKQTIMIYGPKDAGWSEEYSEKSDLINKIILYLSKYTGKILGKKCLYYSLIYKGDKIEEIRIHKKKADWLEYWEHYNIFIYNYESGKRKKHTILGYILKECENAIKIWDAVDFMPNVNKEYVADSDDNIFNLWTGWRFKEIPDFKIDMKKIERIIEHYKNIFYNGGKDDLFEYNMKLFKMMLRGKKTGIQSYIWGKQGTGKNLGLEYFAMNIVGEKYYAYFDTLEALTNRFSGLRSEKIIIVCDELDTYGGDVKTANTLKSLTTSILIRKELKGIDSINIKDYSNYYYLSNYPFGGRTEGKGDRRTQSIKVCGDMACNEEYFKPLIKDMGLVNKFSESNRLSDDEQKRADDIALHFYHYILSFNLEGFNCEKIIKTDDRIQGEILGTNKFVRFIRCLLESYKKKVADSLVKLNSNDIMNRYWKWTNYLGLKNEISNGNGLMKKIYPRLPILKKLAHKHTSKGNYLLFNKSNIDKLIKKLDKNNTFDIEEIDYDISSADSFLDSDELGS